MHKFCCWKTPKEWKFRGEGWSCRLTPWSTSGNFHGRDSEKLLPQSKELPVWILRATRHRLSVQEFKYCTADLLVHLQGQRDGFHQAHSAVLQSSPKIALWFLREISFNMGLAHVSHLPHAQEGQFRSSSAETNYIPKSHTAAQMCLWQHEKSSGFAQIMEYDAPLRPPTTTPALGEEKQSRTWLFFYTIFLKQKS